MEKRTWAKLIVIIVLIGGVGAGLYRQWYWGAGGAGPVVTWGSGRPSEAEKSYYKSQIDKVIVNWQATRRGAERGEKGRFKDSYKTILVIDTAKNAFRIEEDGKIQPENHTELPSNMKWRFYHVTSQGSSELGAVTRLTLRGHNSSRQRGEHFYLVGSGRGAGHIHFAFGASSRGSGSGSGPFTMPVFNFSQKVTEDTYASLIMTDAEYQQYLASVSGSDSNEPNSQGTPAHELSGVEKNKAGWVRVEKLLYQQIEQEVLTGGFTLRSLKIEPGPDFSAAHAKVGVRTEGVLRGMFGGYYWGDVYLEIDLVGDDIWYAADADDPQQPGIRRGGREMDLEFLVCPVGEVPESKRAELLKKGREIQKPLTAAMPSRWRRKLANGVIVSFIGVCENPSVGKQWWGPDGAPMDYIPYTNSEVYGSPGEDRSMYEMAWKVEFPQMPGGSSGGGISSSLEGSKGSYGGSVRDRYGNRISGGLRIGGHSFEKSRKKTTLKLKVRVGEGEYERVEFRDISLVRGEGQGFEVKVIPRNPPSKWKITLSNGAIVEMVGICEVPAAGKKWWGPDGTILDYPPLYTSGSSHRPGKDKKLYEMTWNVRRTSLGGGGNSLVKFHVEGTVFTRGGSHGERYGDIMRRSYAQVYALDKSRREATAKLEVKVGDGEYRKVEFKNISLVPGEDRGFKIELGGKE